MAVIIAVPVLGLLVVVQSAVVSRMPLLYGTADLMLLALIAWAVQERVKTTWHWFAIGGLMVTIVSALPPGVAFLGYFLATAFARAIRSRIWQLPLLAMLAATFVGTILFQGLTLFSLRLEGALIPIDQAFQQISLPSALLNLLLALPMYALLSDLAKWVYPEEIEM